MVSNQQRISLMQIKIDTMEKEIKKLKKWIDKYNSVISCEYYIEGKSYKLNPTIVKILDALEVKNDEN